MSQKCIGKTEKWLPVVGFENLYEVSDRGNIRSRDRISKGRNGSVRLCKGRQLKPSWDGLYYRTTLSDGLFKKSVRVHRLVGDAFLGLLPEGQETRHLDADRRNNCVENLQYGTSQENSDDSVRNGKFRRGLEHQNCFISDELVKEIIALPRGSKQTGRETIAQWADRHGISRGHVYNIRAGHRRK